MRDFFQRLWHALAQRFRNYYEATRYSPKRSRVPGARQDAKVDLSPGTRKELVRKSRYYEKNSAILNRAADLFEAYTVGETGILIIPASSDSGWNLRAKERAHEWAKNPDLGSFLSWPLIQGILARTWFFDGEIFVHLTRGPNGNGRMDRKIQLIEEHRVETPPELASEEGKTVIDGIEIDKNGRPLNYFVREGDGKEAIYVRVPAAEMRHIFEPSRTGQYRGLPLAHAVLVDCNDLDDLELLEQQAAKENAQIANVIKSQSGEIPPGLLRQIRRGGTIMDSQGNTLADERIGGYREALPGATVALKPGEDFAQHRSDRPSVATVDYWDYKRGKICAGIGIPKLLIFPNTRGQGTIARAEFDVANTFFRARSAVLAEAVVEIWLWQTEWAIRTDLRLADAPADWKNVNTRAPRSVNVDVGRNSAAMLAELQAGASNYDLIFAPLGLDPVEQLTRSAFYARLIRDLADQYKVTPAEISNLAGEAIKISADAEMLAHATDPSAADDEEQQTEEQPA